MAKKRRKRTLTSNEIYTKSEWYLSRLNTKNYTLSRKDLIIKDLGYDNDEWHCYIAYANFGHIGIIVFDEYGKHISTTDIAEMWQKILSQQHANHA